MSGKILTLQISEPTIFFACYFGARNRFNLAVVVHQHGADKFGCKFIGGKTVVVVVELEWRFSANMQTKYKTDKKRTHQNAQCRKDSQEWCHAQNISRSQMLLQVIIKVRG